VRALHFEGGLFLIAGGLLVLAAALMWQGRCAGSALSGC